MIALSPYGGRTIALLGLGKSGLAAARALAAAGADVWAWDDDPARRQAAEDEGLPLVDLAQCDWQRPESLVLSPGIPHTHPAPHPVAALARAAGCEIIGDIELLARGRPDAIYVGVTGTNGKSTTTTLIGHILKWAGRQVEVGGNLGTPALSLPPLGSDGIYVLEMSSYQLELTPTLTFDVAVLLNITPDHLDRHGGMAGYVAAKRRIFARQEKPQAAVVGIDDAITRELVVELAATGAQTIIFISAEDRAIGGVRVEKEKLVDDMTGDGTPVLDLRKLPRLPGQHNWQNIAAAYATARCLGIEVPAIVAAIKSFPGLAHRQELIATIDGVRYVNDSKATNADAAAKALACYDAIYWIAGGIAKEGGIASLAPFFPRIRRAFLIGEATDAFGATLDGRVPLERCGDLGKAVAAARDAARADGAADAVVLLSPACASFDQFTDFEARGNAFRHLVEALPGARA